MRRFCAVALAGGPQAAGGKPRGLRYGGQPVAQPHQTRHAQAAAAAAAGAPATTAPPPVACAPSPAPKPRRSESPTTPLIDDEQQQQEAPDPPLIMPVFRQAQDERTTVEVGAHTPVILVDSGWAEKHAYFASLCAAFGKGAAKTLPPEVFAALHQDTDFLKQGGTRLAKMLRDWQQRWAGYNGDALVVWCADCPRAEVWRRDVLPTYKAHRDDKPNEQFNAKAVRRMSGAALAWHGDAVTQLGGDRLEADDVAYLMLQRLRDAGHVGEVFAVSIDGDWQQLAVTPGVTVVAPGTSKRDEKQTRHSDGNGGACSPLFNLLVKALSGDTSDNIKSAAPNRLGEGRAHKLLVTLGLDRAGALHDLRAAMARVAGAIASRYGDDAVAAFRRNLRLVDMSRVPDDLADAFYASFRVDVLKGSGVVTSENVY